MKKKLVMALAVVATAVISVVSLVGCAKPDTDLKVADSQADALYRVQTNTADVAIVDGVYAGYTLKTEGNSYSNCQIITVDDFTPEVEYYGIAAKKENTNLINFINKRLYELKDTVYPELLAKYGLQDRKVDIPAASGAWENWKNEIQNNEIVIGFTMAPPYGMGTEEQPEGFDFDLAKEVFKDQGITIKGKVITWSEKVTLLNEDQIDLVWNGMTINDILKESTAISSAYMKNEQALVVNKKIANKIKKVADFKGYVFTGETESAGLVISMEIFDKVDNGVFREFLEKNPELKAYWMKQKPDWK